MAAYRDKWKANPGGPPRKTRVFDRSVLADMLRREYYDELWDNNPQGSGPPPWGRGLGPGGGQMTCQNPNPRAADLTPQGKKVRRYPMKTVTALLDHLLDDMYEGIQLGSQDIAQYSYSNLIGIWSALSPGTRGKLQKKYGSRLERAFQDLWRFQMR